MIAELASRVLNDDTGRALTDEELVELHKESLVLMVKSVQAMQVANTSNEFKSLHINELRVAATSLVLSMLQQGAKEYADLNSAFQYLKPLLTSAIQQWGESSARLQEIERTNRENPRSAQC